MRGSLIRVGLLAAVLFAGGEAYAQGGGGVPPIPGGFDKEMILKQIKEALPQVLENAQEETLEIAGVVKLKYKKLPTDPNKIAESLGKDLGGGMIPEETINEYLGMFEKDITAVLNETLGNIGTFECLTELKVKSKKIPVGVHRFGIVFDGERPKSIRIFNADKTKMKKAVELRLKTRSTDLQPELSVKLKEPKKQTKGKEKFELRLSFLRFKAKTKSKVQVAGE
jgi:hypothetical protein